MPPAREFGEAKTEIMHLARYIDAHLQEHLLYSTPPGAYSKLPDSRGDTISLPPFHIPSPKSNQLVLLRTSPACITLFLVGDTNDLWKSEASYHIP